MKSSPKKVRIARMVELRTAMKNAGFDTYQDLNKNTGFTASTMSLRKEEYGRTGRYREWFEGLLDCRLPK